MAAPDEDEALALEITVTDTEGNEITISIAENEDGGIVVTMESYDGSYDGGNNISFTAEANEDGGIVVTIENLPDGEYEIKATDADGEDLPIANEDTPRVSPRSASATANTAANSQNGLSLKDMIMYALGAAGLLSMLFFIFFLLKRKRDEEDEEEKVEEAQ